MAHDVFISHAHKDIAIAKAICDELEAAQVKCWITERDIPSGENWPEATRNAIRSSRVMVLLLSENANAASHIEREIAHAFYTGRTIYPVRLTNTPLKRDFLYYLGNVRCFDAFNPPIEQYFDALVAGVRGKMHGGPIALNAAPPRAMSSYSARVERRTLEPSTSWPGAMRAPRHGGLQLLKRASVTVILFSLLWLAWFVYSQGKIGELFGENNPETTDGAASHKLTPPGSAQQAEAGSPAKPTYPYSRFGLWVAPDRAGSTERVKTPRSGDSAAVIPSGTATPPPKPEVNQDPVAEAPRSTLGGTAVISKESPELTDKPAPEAGAEHRRESEKLAEIIENQDRRRPSPADPSLESPPTAEAASTAESTPIARSVPTAESTPLEESTSTAKSALTPESTPTAKSVPMAEPAPIAEATPIAKSIPAPEPAPIGVATPIAKSIPAPEPAPIGEATPIAKSIPAPEPVLIAKSTPTVDSGPTVKSSATGVLSTPAVESAPAPQAAAVAESTPKAETSPTAESTGTAKSTSVAEASPIAQATPGTQSPPIAEATPAARSVPTDNQTAREPLAVSASTPGARSATIGETTSTAPLTASAESTPGVAAGDQPLKSSPDEQSLRQLVLDYLRTAASDDDSAQETFFSTRVNFYGRGILSLPQIRASMKRYRQQWPVRSWQSQGEPEFPNDLHADHPELYEVLQPFVWTVANGSEHKKGTATLYLRIRKDDQGNFRIIHLEQRQP